ncbi:alpha/beta fold hydrolase [Streptomyces graminifolii]|uniref:alpha/beta fold hydrolase n=1 Tax=Streptomyces graminifolii TaxID=1266771 RepID=UPI004059BB94
MIDAKETFGGTWPFAPHYFEGNGFPMHYVDEGQGEPVVLLHGDPTWGYLYRNFIPPLSETHRVVVPDHMGFGKSGTPRDRDYAPKAHVENLANLLDDLGLENVTLVLQDWGGFIGSAYTMLHPDRVKRVFLVNTLTGFGLAPATETSPWFQVVQDHHDAGTVEEILGNLGVNILSVMKGIGFENSAVVNENWLAAYSAPFPTKDETVGSMGLMLDAVLRRFTPYVKELYPLLENLKSKPAMLTVGMKDHAILPSRQIADFQAVWPDRPVIKLPNAGHFSQEDAPDVLIALLQNFTQTT